MCEVKVESRTRVEEHGRTMLYEKIYRGVPTQGGGLRLLKDPAQVRIVRDLLLGLGASRSVLFSTHVLSEAEQMCHRVLILNAGRLAAADSPARLVQSGEAKDFAETFLRLTTPPPKVRNPRGKRDA